MNNLTKPIIIGSVIIALAVISSQWMKQNSIEKQQQAELRAEQFKQAEEQSEKDYKQRMLNICISGSESEYWDYMKLNGTEKDDGTIWAQNSVWDRAEKQKQNAIS